MALFGISAQRAKIIAENAAEDARVVIGSCSECHHAVELSKYRGPTCRGCRRVFVVTLTPVERRVTKRTKS